VTATAGARTRFDLPDELAAGEPPEARGLPRDGVRLLVADPSRVRHARFAELSGFLDAGDLVVVNTSGTLPAAVDGERRGGRPVTVHFSTPLPGEDWVVELRPAGRATGPVRDALPGERVDLPGGGSLTLLDSHPEPGLPGARLWRARAALTGGVSGFLARHGRPIAYGYLTGAWPLPAYQTVFARDPGSAEMPSAGRPFTAELVTALVAAGVVVAPVTLHTGVSSPEEGEPPLAEPFRVPAATARLVNLTRRAGGRIVAAGTTVTRALETVAGPDGTVHTGAGRTELVLGPDRPARVVDGLITGWHAPGASHLLLLEAVAGAELVNRAYREALRGRYLWHEFGDSCLLLPPKKSGRHSAAGRRAAAQRA
jgi:S-adenosylmethionine:tRNA ribosyltransferase-isomerase